MAELSQYEMLIECWRRTGRIGHSRPFNLQDAQRQAYAVAQSMEKQARNAMEKTIKEVQTVTVPHINHGLGAAYIQLKFAGVK